jgi:hypothetical protein
LNTFYKHIKIYKHSNTTTQQHNNTTTNTNMPTPTIDLFTISEYQFSELFCKVIGDAIRVECEKMNNFNNYNIYGLIKLPSYLTSPHHDLKLTYDEARNVYEYIDNMNDLLYDYESIKQLVINYENEHGYGTIRYSMRFIINLLAINLSEYMIKVDEYPEVDDEIIIIVESVVDIDDDSEYEDDGEDDDDDEEDDDDEDEDDEDDDA